MSAFPGDNHVRTCPYCGVKTTFTFTRPDGHQLYEQRNVRIIPEDPKSPMQISQVGLFRCISCGGPVMIRAYGDNLSMLVVLPTKIPKAANEIPEKIRKIYLEALNCFEVKAWNATATMARRAIQEAVLDKGGKGKDLYGQIVNLEESRVITPALAQWAHDIRGIGRDGAHADVPMDVTEPDAAYAVEFTGEFLEHLYVMPARVTAKRSRV